MKIKVPDSKLDEWVDQCRSSQCQYTTDKINFLHFKRLYLAIVHNSGKGGEDLSESLRYLLPNCTMNVRN